MPKQTKARAKRTAGKRYPLNMRTTKDVRERLEIAAARAGRSLAQEVEIRLEKSFDLGDLLAETLRLRYGPTLACILYMMGETMSSAGQDASIFTAATIPMQDWANDAFCFDVAERAACRILEASRPTGEIAVTTELPPQLLSAGYWKKIDVEIADHVIAKAASGEAPGTHGGERLARELRLLAGDELASRFAKFLALDKA